MGDWSVEVTSTALAVRGSGPLPSGPGPLWDRDIIVAIERLTEGAAVFPREWGMIGHFEYLSDAARAAASAPANVEEAPWGFTRPYLTTGDGSKHQQWFFHQRIYQNQNPVTKLVLEVPTEAKAAALPFEFKKVALGEE